MSEESNALHNRLDWEGIARGCVDALNHPERSHPEKPLITVEIKGSLPRRGWPRPKRLLCENSRGGRVYHYDAMSLLAAMAAHGLVQVVFGSQSGLGFETAPNKKSPG